MDLQGMCAMEPRLSKFTPVAVNYDYERPIATGTPVVTIIGAMADTAYHQLPTTSIRLYFGTLTRSRCQTTDWTNFSMV